MDWKQAGYAALCLTVPVLWGLAVYWISGLIEKRALRDRPSPQEQNGAEMPGLPLDYHI